MSNSLEHIVPSMSLDGTCIAFESLDDRLSSWDLNRASDIFVFALRWPGGAPTVGPLHLQLVSQHDSKLPSAASVSGLNYFSRQPLSANGRFLIYLTQDPYTDGTVDIVTKDLYNVIDYDPDFILPGPILQPSDPSNSARDAVMSAQDCYAVYVCGEAIWVSDLTGQSRTGIFNMLNRGLNYPSAPSINGDGRYVVYQSVPANGTTNVFLWDLKLQSTLLLSASLSNSSVAGNGVSLNPLINKSGRWVLFESKATDLVTNVVDPAAFQLYVRDMLTSTTRLLSQDATGAGLAGGASAVGFSASDNLVLFIANSNQVYVGDLVSGTNRLVCTGCGNPSISGDGRYVAYETTNGPAGRKEVWFADLQSNWAGSIGVESRSPLLTYDARYLVFVSKADNLVAGDTNGLSDVFAYDTILGDIVLLSASYETGGSAQGVSARPILGADGRSVIFQSFAPDLAPYDYNGNRDFFIVSLGSDDSDSDWMDDDWELAYFNDLSRNGTEDFDGDGRNDLQEFLCGTDPTNEGSVLRAISMRSFFGTADITILWNAVPGSTYRVQFKNSLTDTAWHDLPGEVTASGPTGSKVDDSAAAGGQRYYRVVLTP